MNKLKLLYDVVKTMRDKEVLKGSLQVTGEKSQTQIFSFANEFERNLLSGETKAKISTQVDCDGNKVKHESYTEFNVQDGHKHPMFPGFKGHGHLHHHDHSHCPMPHHMGHGGFKEKLSRIGFMLNMLNQLKLTEQENQSVLLSLDGNDFPAEMKQALQKKMREHQNQHPHDEQQHKFIHDFCNIENSSFNVNILVNRKNEVEKVVVNLNGQGLDTAKTEALSLHAELNLVC